MPEVYGWNAMENVFFGPGPVELLEKIAETGSINKAAKKMGMSYKKAWKLISLLNEHTHQPVVLLQTGGKKGGGSVLTPEARQLIAFYQLLRSRFTTFLQKETALLKK